MWSPPTASFLRASAEENADLFWGLRGGGGNFGIVTSFEYRLHPVGPIVLAGVMLHPAAKAREVLGFYRDFIGSAPDELTTIVVLRMAPPAPFLPRGCTGNRSWSSARATRARWRRASEAVARRCGEFGEPLVDLIRAEAVRRAPVACSTPPRPTGSAYYWKSESCHRSAMTLIDTLVEHAWAVTSPESYTIIFHLGGAVGRRIRRDRRSRTGGPPTT